MWDKKWSSLPNNMVVGYKKIASISFRNRWFHNLNLNRAYIVQLGRLLLHHYHLPSHDFKLGLSDLLLCFRHDEEQICNLIYIILAFPNLNNSRVSLLLQLHSFGVPLNNVNILCSTTPRVVFLIFQFITSADSSFMFNIV